MSDTDGDGIPDAYSLPLLAEGSYDLIVCGVDEVGVYTVVDESYADIEVLSTETSIVDIVLSQ